MHPKTGRANTEVHAPRTATYTSVEKRITAQFRYCNSKVDLPVHLFRIVMFSCIVVKMYRALAPYFTINPLCI